jgi:molecular chaperone GrpE
MRKIFRRMHRDMPEQDTELNLVGEAWWPIKPRPKCRNAQECEVAARARRKPRRLPRGIRPAEGRARPVARPAGPLQAEFENARKRAERERLEPRLCHRQRGRAVSAGAGHFELALKSTGTAEQLRSGVELIVKQMEDVLRQLQVTAIPAVGEEFDPRHHEALGSVERDDLPDQHVAEEIRRGYKLRERLLRPALVRVASNPKQTSE